MPLVTFKTITQQSFELDLADNVTIGEVKQKIQAEKGIKDFPIEAQKLIYNGKVLDDTTPIGELNIAEKKFIVVMVTKKPSPVTVPQPAAEEKKAELEQPQPSQDTQQKASTEQATPAVAVAPGAPAVVDIPQEHLQTVENIQSMGYPRDEVIRALRAAFFDADRAVEYLCTGIPEGLNLEEQAGHIADEEGGEEGDEGDGLAFLAQSPQFQMIRQLIQQNPASLQEIIQEIANTNPDLMDMIQNNQEEFLALLNQPPAGVGEEQQGAGAEGAAAVQQGGAQQAPPPARNVIMLNAQDREAINRLQAMGFPEGIVIEAYLACDKNEDLAANYILQRMDEEFGGGQEGQ